MNINLALEVEPFPVPTGVTVRKAPQPRQNGMQPLQTIPLSQLDPEALEALCNDFRSRVYSAAGSTPPTFTPRNQPEGPTGPSGPPTPVQEMTTGIHTDAFRWRTLSQRVVAMNIMHNPEGDNNFSRFLSDPTDSLVERVRFWNNVIDKIRAGAV